MPNEAKSRKAFEERVSKHGGYLTPATKRKREAAAEEAAAEETVAEETAAEEGTEERPSDRRITEDSLRQNVILTDEISFNSIINYDFLKELNADNYMVEIISIIIASKKLKNISLPTPFGYFNLYCRSNKNYIARLRNFSMGIGKYEYILLAISNFEYSSLLIKEFRKFLDIKLDNKFCIDISKPDIEFQLCENMCKYIQTANVINMRNKVKMPPTYGGKNYNITYEQIGALMCGIFISEIIRTSGKIVRSAFKNGHWPRNYKELKKRFIQSEKKGNELLRKYVQNPESCPQFVREAVENNVSLQSPFKKKPKKN